MTESGSTGTLGVRRTVLRALVARRDLVLLALVAAVPQLFLSTSVYTDTTAPLQFNPGGLLTSLLFVWSDKVLLGYNQGWGQTYIFPSAVYYALGSAMGLPIWFLERAWLFGILFLAGFGARTLVREIQRGKASEWAGLAGGLVYMLSPFTFLYLQNGSGVLLSYAVLPLLLCLTIRITRTGLNGRRFFALVGLTFIGSFIQPPYIAIDFLVILGYLVFDGILPRPSLRRLAHNLATFAAYLVTVVLLALWWALPALAYVQSAGIGSFIQGENPLTLNTASSYLEVLRMLGNSGFYGTFPNGQPYIAYASLYTTNPIWIASSLAIPMLAIAGFFAEWRGEGKKGIRGKTALFCALLLVLDVPLASGAYPPDNPSPSGIVYLALFNHIPGFYLFKQSYVFVQVIALGSAYLLGTFVMWVLAERKLESRVSAPRNRARVAVARLGGSKWASPLIVGLVVATLLVNGAPVLDAQVVPASSRFASVPAYWPQAAEWINSQPGQFRVFLTPDQYFAMYNWSEAAGGIEPSLIDKSVVEPLAGVAGYGPAGQALVSSVYDMLLRNRTRALPAVLDLLNAKYVLQRDDSDWQTVQAPSPAAMRAILGSALPQVNAFGALSVYENPEWSQAFVFSPPMVGTFDGNVLNLVTAVGGGQLVQFNGTSAGWLENGFTYENGLTNFTVFTNVTLETAGEAGVTWSDGSAYVAAYVGSDQSGFYEDGLPAGTSNGFLAGRDQTVSLEVTVRSGHVVLYANGAKVGELQTNALSTGFVSLGTRSAVAEFNEVLLQNADSPIAAPALDFSALPYGAPDVPGWQANGGDWGISTSSEGGNATRAFPMTAYARCEDLRNASSLVSCSASGNGPATGLTQAGITVNEVNPTYFEISVTAAHGPALLVMSQSFDPAWQLHTPAETLSPIPVDGYAMGWVIHETAGAHLLLQYADQVLFVVGAAISGTFLALLVIASVWRGRTRRARALRSDGLESPSEDASKGGAAQEQPSPETDTDARPGPRG